MGRDQVRLEIHFYVSRHNSPQDAADDQAVEDFEAAVGALLDVPEYQDGLCAMEDCTSVYRRMDPERLIRVRRMLLAAYSRLLVKEQDHE